MKRAYVLIFDGYADWELGHVLPELRRLGGIDIVTVGFTGKAVVSMGGLRVVPDTVLSKIYPDDVLIFIVPGGYLWEGSYPPEIEPFLHRLERSGIPVAAICAATTMLVRAGLVRGRKHTSNSLKYLTDLAPGYAENALYVDSPAVRDRHVITASGLGSIEFTMEIFHELEVSTPEMRKLWYDAFKHGIYPENIPAGH